MKSFPGRKAKLFFTDSSSPSPKMESNDSTPEIIELKQNHDEERQDSDASRRETGRKPPKVAHVQWANTQAADKREKWEREEEENSHLLDEHGLDRNAFRELHRRLSRTDSRKPHRPDHNRPAHSAGSTSLTDDELEWEKEKAGQPLHRERSKKLHAYVAPDEKDGLPSPPPLPPHQRRPSSSGSGDHDSNSKEARYLVHRHKAGFWGYFSRHHNHDRPASVTDSEAETKDVESKPARSIPRLEGSGTGVLASLLALYNPSVNKSGYSTPSTLVDGASHSPASTSGTTTPNNIPPPPPPANSAQRLSSHVLPLPAHLPKAAIHRPKTAKSAGGVVGSLIASTGNISGAATPAASTIAPDPKRPGYHLNRYSLDREAPDDGATANIWNGKKRSGGALGMHAQLGMRPISAPNSPDEKAEQERRTNSDPDIHSKSEVESNTFSNSKRNSSWTDALSSGFSAASSHLPYASLFKEKTATPASTDEDGEQVDWNWNKGGSKDSTQRKKKRERRRKAEIFITRHVAQVMERQSFLLKLARSLMMFGAPSHRLEAQIQSTAHVLDLENVSCLYLPNTMLVSFGDLTTSTSNIKFIKQGSSLDLGKLLATHKLYWKVIHDQISVTDAGAELDDLMTRDVLYGWWKTIIIGGLCSAAICSVSFKGSFVDCLISFPLGALLVTTQLFAAKNELYSNVFEIFIATLLSFIAAALASTNKFCYTAVASSSVVLILPGYIVLSGSLELASRSIISGSVRMCYSLVYSLFLGFGLAMGATIFSSMKKESVQGADDLTCGTAHPAGGPWWQQTPSLLWAILTVPLYSLCLSMRNQAPIWRKEMLATILISSGGWAANHFTGVAFPGRSDVTSAVGSFAVGVVANIWGRYFRGTSFVVMITGIMFQLPSGLSQGGLLTFAKQNSSDGSTSTTTYSTGFDVASQLVSVAIGLTVGLFASVVVVHPFGGGKKRAGGLFSL